MCSKTPDLEHTLSCVPNLEHKASCVSKMVDFSNTPRTLPILDLALNCFRQKDMSKIAGSSFSISVRGHISHAELPMLRGMDLMCKYSYELGSDWVVAAGLEEGFSQV